MTDTGQDPEAGGEWADADDAALARGMGASADDATFFPAWREFERRHLGPIKSFIDARGRDLDDATRDDVLMLTLRQIQRKVDRYVPRRGATFKSWCTKLADNVLKDAWRGRLPLVYDAAPDLPVLVSFDEIEERYEDGLVAGGGDEDPAVTAAGDEDLLPRSERDQVLWEAFGALTEVDQIVLWCRLIHHDSDERVAEIVKKPVDHVRKILYKAERKLGREFERRMAGRRRAS